MKKIKFTGKLSLNKETISKLNNEQMNAVVGGGSTNPGCTGTRYCPTDVNCTATQHNCVTVTLEIGC